MSAAQAAVADRPTAVVAQPNGGVAIDCNVRKIMYGSFVAVRRRLCGTKSRTS